MCMLKVTRVAFTALLVVLVALGFVVRFKFPELTETQLLLTFPHLWGGTAVAAFMMFIVWRRE